MAFDGLDLTISCMAKISQVPARYMVVQSIKPGIPDMPRKRDAFTIAAQILRRREPQIDWKDEDERREYKKRKAREARERVLPADRRCPCCGEVRISTRQWELLPRFKLGQGAEALRVRERVPEGRHAAVCKGCAMTYFPGARG